MKVAVSFSSVHSHRNLHHPHTHLEIKPHGKESIAAAVVYRDEQDGDVIHQNYDVTADHCWMFKYILLKLSLSIRVTWTGKGFMCILHDTIPYYY